MARYVSDTARANWSSLISVSLGVGLVAVAAVSGELAMGGRAGNLDAAVLFYLMAWPLFAVIDATWTHLTYTRRGPRALGTTSRRERALKRRWWSLLFGYGGASSWTLTGAAITIFSLCSSRRARSTGRACCTSHSAFCASRPPGP